MAKKLVSLIGALLMSGPALANDQVVSTNYKKIDRIQLAERPEGSSTFYFASLAGWGAPGCQSATYAYTRKSDPISTEMLSMAAAAKAAGQEVRFKGTCDANKDYFRVQYMFIK